MSLENRWVKVPGKDLTRFANPGKKVKVTYPTSQGYNGGIVVQGEWFEGYQVDEPIVPAGYELRGIGMGLQLNARPPLCTMLLVPIGMP